MSEQKSGLKAGLIAGVAWAVLMSLANVLEIGIYYHQALNYYTGLYEANASSLGGMTAVQYINYNIEFNTIITVVAGVGFGALIGILFVWIAPRFLRKQSYMIKGIVVSIFFWLLYQLGLVGVSDSFELLASLAVSLFAGYILGFLYTRYVGPPNYVSPPPPAP